ncbi:hypothetical protein [Mucilaginibacter ginsenosidivorax]|nr:hypothetical protein [Mucilaginibacter ginsenosidivorax]
MLPKYLITDQPTTCPICGTRTDVVADFVYHSTIYSGMFKYPM